MTDQSTSDTNDAPVLYAGKFKTIEDLEAGYNNSAKVYQENEDLKRKFEETTKVPEDYAIPQGIELHEDDIANIKRTAKESGLTQAQFDKLASVQNSTVKSKLESFESAKKEIGADNLNMLQDFVGKNYPAKVAEKMLKEAIKDKDLRAELLDLRTKSLDSSIPGSNRVNVSNYTTVNHEDVKKAREVMMGSRGKARVEAQKRYVALSSQLAHAGQ
jgi:uncharacterized protein (UPF0335 family)